MRLLPAVLVALACLALLLSSVGARADIPDPGAPKYVNRLLTDFVTPTVAPGRSLTFSFAVNNTYESANMTEIAVTASIYMYATKDEAREVNATFPNPPLINGESPGYVHYIASLYSGSRQQISFDIDTTRKTPHGSYFSQSAYFMRFIVEFHFSGNSTHVILKSKGWFTDEQWSHIINEDSATGGFNTTYLHSLGVDGIIPDSSFGLKEPIPKWPLALLAAGGAGAGFMALYYLVLDNPGKFPYLEKRFYYLRGKLGEFGRHLKDRRRK